jgi:transposase
MQDLVREAIGQGRGAVNPAAPRHPGSPVRLRCADRSQPGSLPPRGALMTKNNARARRLPGRQDDYLRFTRDWRVPPDNNGCERDIGMTRLNQEVSGCLRALTGARQFCAIRSYLPAAARHDLGLSGALVMLAAGQPWLPPPAKA